MIPRGVTDSKTQAQSTQAILFDIDGTLIESGGASDRAWHRAFDELRGVDVQISKVTGKGVPDPAVGRQAFEAVITGCGASRWRTPRTGWWACSRSTTSPARPRAVRAPRWTPRTW
jgi:hypothetical protein